MAQWAEHIYGASNLPVNVNINVLQNTKSGSSGGIPTKWQYLRTREDGLKIFESCASYKLRTGQQGHHCSAGDITINLLAPVIRQRYYFNPAPDTPTAPLPDKKIDLVTMLAHETGHGFGMAGWLNSATGLPTGTGISVYDSLIADADSVQPVFTGPAAAAVLYGSAASGRYMPVYKFSSQRYVSIARDGVTYPVNQAPQQNIYHYGRFTSSDSDTDQTFFGLMAGNWKFKSARRISVGPLDFAIMKDLGIPVE
jgi:hypothetical protein